ncbi:hypothetical protein [Streptomyces sclerotialus]|uniref:hypothetical protein n=1 Tax=Streptomyces sclerotialus TaxID=1957 RepID=UPI0018C9A346
MTPAPPDPAVRHHEHAAARHQRRHRQGADPDERYVREWLGGMVVGGLVEYEPDSATHTLPPEHAAGFTEIDVKSIEGDPVNVYYVATKAPADAA